LGGRERYQSTRTKKIIRPASKEAGRRMSSTKTKEADEVRKEKLEREIEKRKMENSIGKEENPFKISLKKKIVKKAGKKEE